MDRRPEAGHNLEPSTAGPPIFPAPRGRSFLMNTRERFLEVMSFNARVSTRQVGVRLLGRDDQQLVRAGPAAEALPGAPHRDHDADVLAVHAGVDVPGDQDAPDGFR